MSSTYDEEFSDEKKYTPSSAGDTIAPLNRITTYPGRTIGIQLPRITTQTSTHIPIGFRTLSIQVQNSIPVERHVKRTPSEPPSKWRFWQKSKQSTPSKDVDSEYFSQLEYHTLSVEAVCQRLNVSPQLGHDPSTAARHLARDGPNVLGARKSQFWKKMLRYLFGDFCSILWVGVVIFFISWRPLGNPPAPYNLALAIVVLLVIFIQAIFSGLQDYSAQRVMQSILNLVPENAVVIRDGRSQTVTARDLVVGDVVQLSSGQKVPADIRIIEASSDLKFDKSILTGESEEIAGTVESSDPNYLEASNIALLGTLTCNGTATGIVVLTGERTVMGRINALTASAHSERTNLQREITRFVKIIICLTLSLVMIMLITWLAWIRRDHYEFINTVGILTNLMSLVVAFIPEGMPMAVALTLSTIAKRMRDAKVLPKSLSTVETMGCVNVICSDKTGTLTENKMTVASLGHLDQVIDIHDLPVNSTSFESIRVGMAMCNDAAFDSSDADVPVAERTIRGNATDGALLRFGTDLPGGTEVITNQYHRAFDIPFNSKNKFAVTYITAGESEPRILVKGAPDIILDRCTTYLSGRMDGHVESLSQEARQTLIDMQEAWSRQGQRVILLAERYYTPRARSGTTEFEQEVLDEASRQLCIVGLVGIADPARADIPQTVIDVRRCGSRFFMVTGDFSLTACSIARQIGIFTRQNDPDRIADFKIKGRDAALAAVQHDRLAYIDGHLLVEGKEIPDISDENWDIICKYEEIVFARTTPEQKLRIVVELKTRGCVVAVTGDGVNDAPALKAADVGIALVSGSEVAMEAADLVLMGPFSSVVDAIRQGRLVFQNLQKVIAYLLPAGSYSEDWPVVLNVFFGCPLPLSSFLMIIICCFTDLACCLTLIFEREEFDLLTLPPRDPSQSHLVGIKLYTQAYLFIGTMETLCAHSMFFYYIYSYAGIPIRDMFFVFEGYSEGYYGHTQDELNSFLATGQCVYFVTLVILQFFNLNSVRNKKLSIFQAGPQRNWKLVLGPVVSLGIAIFVTEVSGIQDLFGTASVPIKFWLLPLPLGVGILMMDEVRKVIVRTWPKGPVARMAW